MPAASYSLLTRVVTKNQGGAFHSYLSSAPYETLAEIMKALSRADLIALAKRHRPRKGYALVEVAVEVFRRDEKGEKRISVRRLSLDT